MDRTQVLPPTSMRLTHDSFLCEEMGPVTEGAREYADLPLGLQWEKGFQQTPGAFHNVTGHPSCPVFCGTPFPTGGLEHPPPPPPSFPREMRSSLNAGLQLLAEDQTLWSPPGSSEGFGLACSHSLYVLVVSRPTQPFFSPLTLFSFSFPQKKKL